MGIKGVRIPIKLPFKGATDNSAQFVSMKAPVAKWLKFNNADQGDLEYQVKVKKKGNAAGEVIVTRIRRPGYRTRAVRVSVKDSKDNWSFGGYLSQEYRFTASGYRNNGKAFNRTQDLLVNDVLILNLPLLAEGGYRLRYFPPNYFPDVKIQIWEYVEAVIEKPARLNQSDQASFLEPISELNTTVSNLARTVGEFASCLETIKTTADRVLVVVSDIKCSATSSPDDSEPPSQPQQQFFFLQ